MSRYDRPSHRVYCSFFFRATWQVQFLEADLTTSLPRKFSFGSPDKLRELAKRGEAWNTSEARQMLDHAIANGRGGFYLNLTPAQYAKLRKSPSDRSLLCRWIGLWRSRTLGKGLNNCSMEVKEHDCQEYQKRHERHGTENDPIKVPSYRLIARVWARHCVVVQQKGSVLV